MTRSSICMSGSLLLLGAACVAGLALPAHGEPTAAESLAELFEDDWQSRLREDPLFATNVGDRRGDARLPGTGLADHRRRYDHRRVMLERLAAIDREALSPAEQVSYDIFARLTQDSLREYEFNAHLQPITNRNGFHVDFPQLPQRMPLATVRNHEDYLSRLEAFPRYTQQHIELMRKGIASGYTLPAVVLEGYEGAIDPHIVDDSETSLLFAPFDDLPESWDAATRERLVARAREQIRDSVVPAYREFRRFMAEEYVPAARSDVGASALPDGKAFYEHRVRRYTTLELTPAEVHQIGLLEVARIRAEMTTVMKSTGFAGSFAEFIRFLRTDERFYTSSPEELMREVSHVLKRMDGELPRLFGTLPRMPYGIRPVPDFIAPKTTTAYYERPAGDGSRAGFYYVNTYNLRSRPRYEIETLSLHEAVPGHHLQIALQQELSELPRFRRFAGFTAFVEGWALYSERLGREVGFYRDPYSMFGHLTYEMWRACRLVVDPGMHYLGWTREQAIDFMLENTALTEHNVTTEVDRYIAWPGQALAYKMGELKIRELRALSETELGPRFDIRRFHDVVLGAGSVPLSVLEANVRRYIEVEGRLASDGSDASRLDLGE